MVARTFQPVLASESRKRYPNGFPALIFYLFEKKILGIFTFGADSTLIAGYEGESTPYSISGNTLTVTQQGEDGTPFDMVFTITKLTDAAFEGTSTQKGTAQVISPDGITETFEYTYSITMKFAKP